MCAAGVLLDSSGFFGGHSEEDPPVSIPNTEVKLFSADGTAWVTMWESRSPPIFLPKPLSEFLAQGLFLFLLSSDTPFSLPEKRFTIRTLHSRHCLGTLYLHTV